MHSRVKIFKEGLDRKQIVRFVKPGDFFGYRPYFIKERYTLTAAAMTDCVLISLPLKELADIVGVSRNTISSIETGQFNPTAKLALVLSIALDVKFERSCSVNCLVNVKERC